jgi:hypothetical protein
MNGCCYCCCCCCIIVIIHRTMIQQLHHRSIYISMMIVDMNYLYFLFHRTTIGDLQLSIHLLMHLNRSTGQYIYLSTYLPIYSTWERGRLVEGSIEEWIDREAVRERGSTYYERVSEWGSTYYEWVGVRTMSEWEREGVHVLYYEWVREWVGVRTMSEWVMTILKVERSQSLSESYHRHLLLCIHVCMYRGSLPCFDYMREGREREWEGGWVCEWKWMNDYM